MQSWITSLTHCCLRYSSHEQGLQSGDVYKTKPQLAVEILQELQSMQFRIELVLADSLYGECGDVINVLERFNLPFIVAIRSNHGVLMPLGQKVRYNRWRAYTQALSHRPSETRYIREGSVVGGFPDLRQLPGEIVFGKVRSVRYYEISKTDNPTTNPLDTWFIMTNLPFVLAITIGQTLQSTWPD